MNCKYCGTELPATAKYCDVCGAKVERETGTRVKKKALKRKFSWKLAILPAMAVIFLIGAAIASHTNSGYYSYQDEAEKFQKMSSRVTVTVFDKIEKGMTYNDVVKIIGEDGIKSYHGTGFTEYSWPGEYYGKIDSLDPKLILAFDDDTDTVENIEEINIVDGKEIYENEKSHREAKTSLSEEEIQNIPEAASYETVCEIMGCEGVLVTSMQSYGSVHKSYCWRYLDDNQYKEAYLSFTNDRYNVY